MLLQFYAIAAFEASRWLLARDEYSMEARVAIKKLRGFRNDEDVQVRM